MFDRIVITAWSLRYLKPAMIYWRIYRTLKGAAIGVVENIGLGAVLFKRNARSIEVSPLPTLSSRYHCEDIDLSARHFSFLRDTLTLPVTADEMRAAVDKKPLLWQFHFGYHDYLLALLSQDDADDALLNKAVEFALEWDEAFALRIPGARKSAWHPYVLSIRIESWVRMHGIAVERGWPENDERLNRLAGGVEQMTAVLLRNLEKGTMANHLLRNIKALVFAGLFLTTDAGASARRIGTKLLNRELDEQILADGCHFERSPMYHVSVLNDVLDMEEAMLLAGSTVPEGLTTAAALMTDFLQRMRHPDGEVPMFNDSTRSFFLRTDEVLERGLVLCREFEDAPLNIAPSDDNTPEQVSGLLLAETPRLWLVFDAGLVGPEYQPGHAHCDTLSFELSVDGERFITDTGVFHYRESTERTYSRSTAAHSTIEIDGLEQSEVWKSFRVGRRAHILHLSREERYGMTILRGAHDGYTRFQRGLIHERVVVVGADWIIVVDWLHGTGSHRWRSRVHLQSGVIATQHTGIDLQRGDTSAFFSSIGNASVELEQTEMYPAFGDKEMRSTIVMHGQRELPTMSGFLLSYGGAAPPIDLDDTETGIIRIGTLTLKSVLRR